MLDEEDSTTISEPPRNRWRNRFGGMKVNGAKRLRGLDRERPVEQTAGRGGVGQADAQGLAEEDF
jgi:hypothetical protein